MICPHYKPVDGYCIFVECPNFAGINQGFVRSGVAKNCRVVLKPRCPHDSFPWVVKSLASTFELNGWRFSCKQIITVAESNRSQGIVG